MLKIVPEVEKSRFPPENLCRILIANVIQMAMFFFRNKDYLPFLEP